MLRNYYINKEWIVSGTARRIYRVAAGLSLAWLPALITLALAGAISETLLPFIKLLLFIGVLGTATTMVAMEYFLFGFDTSSSLKKAFWFCLIMLPLLGAPLYCFLVYSRSDVFKTAPPERAKATSA